MTDTEIETVVVGGGQAGLALARHLTDRGREHVLPERGRVAERWHGERWDSFTMLTPNRLIRLLAGRTPVRTPTASWAGRGCRSSSRTMPGRSRRRSAPA